MYISENIYIMCFGFFVFAIFTAATIGNFAAMICDEASTKSRVTCVGIGYSLSVIINSFTPVINLQMTKILGTSAAPSFFIMICVGISLVTLYKMKDKQIYDS